MCANSSPASGRVSEKARNMLDAIVERSRKSPSCDRTTVKIGATLDLAIFLTGVDTAFLATVDRKGRPYTHCRRGSKGFVKILNETTLGFLPSAASDAISDNLAKDRRADLLLMRPDHRQFARICGYPLIVNKLEFISLLGASEPEISSKEAILFSIENWRFDIS